MSDFPKFRNIIQHSDSIAFGCSHTWGVGVEAEETWPYLLGAKNFGVGAASSNQLVRLARGIIPEQMPKIVYCLWPDWSRFEYIKDNTYYQSLPTDPDRIDFMDMHDDEWCRRNFANDIEVMREICQENQCRLIDMTLYDLIPYIDHSDKWPVSKLGHHYAPEWHVWVAELFKKARDSGSQFALAYD